MMLVCKYEMLQCLHVQSLEYRNLFVLCCFKLPLSYALKARIFFSFCTCNPKYKIDPSSCKVVRARSQSSMCLCVHVYLYQ